MGLTLLCVHWWKKWSLPTISRELLVIRARTCAANDEAPREEGRGREEGRQLREGRHKLLLWKVRTRGPQLGRKSRTTETSHFWAPLCSRLSPDSWILQKSPCLHTFVQAAASWNWVQTKLGKNVHNPQRHTLRAYFDDNNVTSTVTKMPAIFIYKLPKHHLQSHLIFTTSYEWEVLSLPFCWWGKCNLSEPQFPEGKHTSEVCRGWDENIWYFLGHY